jgi:hypothetical protein
MKRRTGEKNFTTTRKVKDVSIRCEAAADQDEVNHNMKRFTSNLGFN